MKIAADPVMQALRDAGIADDNTSRIVIDLCHGHLPVVHIERHGDDKLIDVVRALAGVEITRKDRAQQPEILGYVWTDPRTGEQLRLAPDDVAVLMRAEPDQPAYYVDRMPRVGGPPWLTPDQIRRDVRLVEATGPQGITVRFDPAIPVDTAYFVGSCSCKCGVTNHDEYGCRDKTCDCTTPVSRLVVKATGIGEAVEADVCLLGCKVCFPEPLTRCPHHGETKCRECHANPGDCNSESRQVGCGFWSATGMHWDTCPNRRN